MLAGSSTFVGNFTANQTEIREAMIQVLTNSATTDTGTGDAPRIHQQKGVVAIIPKYWRMPAISVKKHDENNMSASVASCNGTAGAIWLLPINCIVTLTCI